MLAGAVRRYIAEFGVLPGERAVIFTTNDSTRSREEPRPEVGAEVVAVVDARRGEAVTAAHGDTRVEAVTVRDADGTERTVACDLVSVSGGWNPVTQLWRAIGGGLAYDEDRACFLPNGDGPSWLEVVGAASGEGLSPSAPLWFSPADDLSHHYVDLQRDQTVADVLESVAGGLRSVEHVKRATYIGTAIDQGRTSGVLTAEIVNAALGWEPGAQGPTNARPPFTPVSFAVLAGPYRGAMLDPERRAPIHPWHVANGAVFENVGQWKRPWYFPNAGEDMEDTVLRECAAVRTGVGVMDASTLGKIEVVGPDAPVFLDRMYTNRMSTLAFGRIRYGVMPKEPPAAITASHIPRPCHAGTLISYASSPVKLTRATRAGTPATSPSRQDMNGKAPASRSMSVSAAARTSRARGPFTAIVDHCSVTLVQ